MKQGILPNTARQARQIAQQAAKQMGEEPFEIAKTAGKQVVGAENNTMQVQTQLTNQPQEKLSTDINMLKERDNAASRALYNNLQNEIKEIGRQNNALEQAKKAAETSQLAGGAENETVVEPSAKRSRNPLKGMARKLVDLGKKAEIRMPPSG